MRVPMVQIREMGMTMAHRRMPVGMRMRLRAFVAAMGVLVVSIMDVAVFVLQGFVLVLVPVALA